MSSASFDASDARAELAHGQRLRRPARREQIVAAATRAFARSGFAATSLDDVAAEAGVSRVILYRHFASKADLYRAALDHASARLVTAAGARDYTMESVDALVEAAVADPAGFQLLFRHAAREPEFRRQIDEFQASMITAAYRQLAVVIPDASWAQWAAHLAPVVAVEAIIAWLDAGQPDRERIGARIRDVLGAIVLATQPR